MTFGTRNNAARKLRSDDVEMIRRRYQAGETQGALSREYGVSVGQIGRIVRGESWQGSHKASGLPPDPEAFLRKLEEVQASVQAPIKTISPLEGGDTPDETKGTGMDAITAKAAEYGVKPK